jgi:hypothetical protein
MQTIRIQPARSCVRGHTRKSPHSGSSGAADSGRRALRQISSGTACSDSKSPLAPITPSRRLDPTGQILAAGAPFPNASLPCTTKQGDLTRLRPAQSPTCSAPAMQGGGGTNHALHRSGVAPASVQPMRMTTTAAAHRTTATDRAMRPMLPPLIVASIPWPSISPAAL